MIIAECCKWRETKIERKNLLGYIEYEEKMRQDTENKFQAISDKCLRVCVCAKTAKCRKSRSRDEKSIKYIKYERTRTHKIKYM